MPALFVESSDFFDCGFNDAVLCLSLLNVDFVFVALLYHEIKLFHRVFSPIHAGVGKIQNITPRILQRFYFGFLDVVFEIALDFTDFCLQITDFLVQVPDLRANFFEFVIDLVINAGPDPLE